ncbi:MAG: flagellar hook-length control protein FliK [Paraburkholderia sp.]|uniref:flagellar hook-length control protein FliK n=1 Tax=Paraburkholderia sp. TaxID=1926495 RepID=UPI00121DAAFF|nr:flagellar hook-length control protein FliK [Paraburkholderia sp.]TAL93253.1 MAG: flagellar hook-length control protein FliK [Paraburkholderia sp.]
MNGIDTAVASLLASRVDSLLSIGSRADVATSQTGASALAVDTPVTPGGALPAAPATPQASAQTALSAVALTLDAIARSGGAATPAVVGQVPVWAAAPAIDVAIEGMPLPLFDTPAATGSASAAAGGATPNAGAGVATGAAAASVVASPLPVAALAAALARTVAESGLFYESHLAQWLSGQRTPASLAGEPQNRLADAAAQLPLDWSTDGEAAAQPWASGTAAQARTTAATQNPNAFAGGGAATSRGASDASQTQAARFVALELAADDAFPDSSQSLRSLLHTSPGDAASSANSASTSQQLAASIHPATIPLVRQQLDLLATGQFRWTGEAWPGARLDWTIEQDGDEWQRSGGGAEGDEPYPWRTRLTLSLPSLGTIDADLTLNGTQLMVRVQASPNGATRLAAQGDLFRQRLAAAGIDLSALSIREIGGGEAGGLNSGGASAAQATSAYARSAAAAGEAASAAARAAGAGSASGAGTSPHAAPPDAGYDWDLA